MQKGPKTGQAGGYFGRAPLINIGAEIEDYDDTMAILENLDLLVTVDTSVAHLAGAMGRPVWIMLPRAPDWRWLLERGDTPWYPTRAAVPSADRSPVGRRGEEDGGGARRVELAGQAFLGLAPAPGVGDAGVTRAASAPRC